jgi:hypothetical protein
MRTIEGVDVRGENRKKKSRGVQKGVGSARSYNNTQWMRVI